MFDAVHGRFENQDGALRAAGYVAAAGGVGPGASPSLELPRRRRGRARRLRRRRGVQESNPRGDRRGGHRTRRIHGSAPAPARAQVGTLGEDGEDAKAEAKAKAAPAPAPEGTVDLVIERLRKVMGSADQGAAQRAARAAGFVIAGGCEWKDARALLRSVRVE